MRRAGLLAPGDAKAAPNPNRHPTRRSKIRKESRRPRRTREYNAMSPCLLMGAFSRSKVASRDWMVSNAAFRIWLCGSDASNQATVSTKFAQGDCGAGFTCLVELLQCQQHAFLLDDTGANQSPVVSGALTRGTWRAHGCVRGKAQGRELHRLSS